MEHLHRKHYKYLFRMNTQGWCFHSTPYIEMNPFTVKNQTPLSYQGLYFANRVGIFNCYSKSAWVPLFSTYGPFYKKRDILRATCNKMM